MSGDPGPSDAPPGVEEEENDEEQEIDEMGALQIESAQTGKPRRRGLLGKLIPGRRRKYGQVTQTSSRGLLEAGTGGDGRRRGRSLMNCFGFLPGLHHGAFGGGGGETEEEPLLFALTWAQPHRFPDREPQLWWTLLTGDLTTLAIADQELRCIQRVSLYFPASQLPCFPTSLLPCFPAFPNWWW